MKGFRTVVFNGAVVALPILDQLTSVVQGVSPFLGAKAALILASIGLVNVILRAVTDSPIFKPE